MSSGAKGAGTSGKSSISSRASGDRGSGEEKLPLPGASYMEAIELTTNGQYHKTQLSSCLIL